MSKKDEVVIRVSNVAKDFYLPHEKSNSIKTKIVRMFDKKQKGGDTQHALKDISFEVKKGEFFGIVGRNGSGKSTLLKIISQIYKPTKGSVAVSGRLVPFIELGVGFNPELTGRENVFLNGALLGFTRKEIEAQYDDIVSFAELEDFMDQKLKNYSSGMQVRLAFSVAIRAESDILILDEVLAVGDEAFQRKCNDYFFRAKREGKTVVLVTHSMESVRQFCDRAVLIDNGLIQAEGNPDKVANKYSKLFIDEYIEERESNVSYEVAEKTQLSDVSLDSLIIKSEDRESKVIGFKKDFSIEVTLSSARNYSSVNLGVHIINQAGQVAVGLSTKPLKSFSINKNEKIIFRVQNILAEGDYYLALAAEDRVTKKLLIKESELYPFSVLGIDRENESSFGMSYPNVEIIYRK